MDQLMQWLSMGGYSLYIWPAYGLALLVFMLNGFSIKWQRHRTKRQLSQWFKRWSP